MHETAKMNKVRLERQYDRIFVGMGIDIGCGNDLLDKNVFKNIKTVLPYDLEQGNAQTCSNLKSNSFDFVYSSHCLEHLDDPFAALNRWVDICKPEGYIVVAVPHEVYYEKGVWPSLYGFQHKWSFRLEDKTSMPKSINVKELLSKLSNRVAVVGTELFLLNFDFARFWEDQTLREAVCQIEFILKKNRS